MCFLNIFRRAVIIFGGPGGGPDNNFITINRFISRLEQRFESPFLRHTYSKYVRLHYIFLTFMNVYSASCECGKEWGYFKGAFSFRGEAHLNKRSKNTRFIYKILPYRILFSFGRFPSSISPFTTK